MHFFNFGLRTQQDSSEDSELVDTFFRNALKTTRHRKTRTLYSGSCPIPISYIEFRFIYI